MSAYYNEIDPGAAQWLRGYGNAINPWNAAAVIAAGMAELEEAA